MGSHTRLAVLGALAVLLLDGLAVSPQAQAGGRPLCLVSNERTGLGSRSLQDGVQAAAPGDTLVVKGTCVGPATIDRDLTLKGVTNLPFGIATIDGGATAGVLRIDNVSVVVANLTLTNGSSGSGGAIYNNAGSVVLKNSIVKGNAASSQGGGIFNDAGSFTLADSTVSDNTAGFRAGGIFNTGQFRIIRSDVSGNNATSVGLGGGIVNFGSLNVDDSS